MTADSTSAVLVDAEPAPTALARYSLPTATLAAREFVRFFRQRTRIVGALGQPMIFWVLFGAGLGGSFRPESAAGAAGSFQEFFFAGVAVMIVLFTAIFSTISIIEDRREGFLQAVLASPAPRMSIVMGKLLGGTALAVLQALLFLWIGPFLALVGLSPEMSTGLSLANAAAVVSFLALIAFALTALGYLIAWPIDSTQGFHAIMSVFLMPMWLLSGALFPAPSSGWLAWIMRLNPLTYGVAGLRRLMSPSMPSTAKGMSAGGLPAFSTCLAAMLLFAAVCVSLDVWLTQRPSSSNAR